MEDKITLKVRERSDFFSLEKITENITSVDQAITLWKDVPNDKLNEFNSISLVLESEDSFYNGMDIDILIGKRFNFQILEDIPRILENPKVQEIIKELVAKLPQLETRGNVPEQLGYQVMANDYREHYNNRTHSYIEANPLANETQKDVSQHTNSALINFLDEITTNLSEEKLLGLSEYEYFNHLTSPAIKTLIFIAEDMNFRSNAKYDELVLKDLIFKMSNSKQGTLNDFYDNAMIMFGLNFKDFYKEEGLLKNSSMNVEERLGQLLYQRIKKPNCADIVKKYIEKGADVNYVQPEYGYTSLHMAAYSADIKTIKLLIDAKCIVNPLSRDGKTPLDAAVSRHNRESVISLLTENGARSGLEFNEPQRRHGRCH